ncbi:biogenesis of lysosome-related organelles complex 1 subunit 1 isoform X2 [Amborella trichopoda]|uniref:Biogenesis of lysosome-related organelles complex 1 subunit 1 n=1 Tax=Amborella trichopoda TaxID=13333 RepID=W1NMR0_AMBTC|nr:biogenesis of lysosome-related organelles complex 1 subunit 1 isoform X2 [Amborella trichopoda]ERM96793.1 hypothetical protein AMTR_s00256p00017450 [Amborella trichopoda]|eukprot:XP_006829377.1 biogenesis of lysosome-related organelles complex 1 subunit 1 isoform X2 [Amborella trichopoda]
MEKKGGAESGNLEQALVHLVHEYNHKTLFIREKTENAKKDALRSGLHVSGLLVDSVNGGVQESFINEKRIEFETRALASTIMRYTKQTNQWLAASHAINSAIKEIGDFENWMKTMDYDCKSISASLCNISKTRH